MKTQKKQLNTWVLVLYFMAFLGIWFIWEFFLRHVFLDKGLLLHELYGISIKLLIWTLPALLLIRRFSSDLFLSFKELFKNPAKWSKSFPYVLFFIVLHIASFFSQDRSLDLSSLLSPKIIGTVIFVGITEEIVFRGWLLNAFLTKMTKWKAIALNGILFLLIHFPIWINAGSFIEIFTSGGFLTIFVLSIIFSWVFIENKSLLPSIFLHMLWNFLTMLSVQT